MGWILGYVVGALLGGACGWSIAALHYYKQRHKDIKASLKQLEAMEDSLKGLDKVVKEIENAAEHQ